MSSVAAPNFKPVQKLLTAEEFCEQYDGQRVELAKGVVVQPGDTPNLNKQDSHVAEVVILKSKPTDVWSKVLAKVLEYLDSGVKVVLQVEPETRSVISYRLDEKPRTFTQDQVLELPDILPGFSILVSKLFA